MLIGIFDASLLREGDWPKAGGRSAEQMLILSDEQASFGAPVFLSNIFSSAGNLFPSACVYMV